ncbi:hypothetical protein BX600DRAFT_107156 [Xylariales sp. PMI_506]|nr:hypothetical protein BX600DRAFT_107156 [Xylariales sp. PMI_506]
MYSEINSTVPMATLSPKLSVPIFIAKRLRLHSTPTITTVAGTNRCLFARCMHPCPTSACHHKQGAWYFVVTTRLQFMDNRFQLLLDQHIGMQCHNGISTGVCRVPRSN